MKASRMTQKKAVFYILFKAYRENPDQYIPAWKFVGELYVEELGTHFFMSYKCPANGVNLHFENPGLIERRTTTGKSGAKYYEYRLAPNPSREKIQDEDILEFYKLIRAREVRPSNGEKKN